MEISFQSKIVQLVQHADRGNLEQVFFSFLISHSTRLRRVHKWLDKQNVNDWFDQVLAKAFEMKETKVQIEVIRRIVIDLCY